MLKKMVNGIEEICSEEEERIIRMKWALNTKYPEYRGHLMFDGVSEPKHHMENCKKQFLAYLQQAIVNCIKVINLQIENAEENGDQKTKTDLLAKRKYIKSLAVIDISKISDIDTLHKAMPPELIGYYTY